MTAVIELTGLSKFYGSRRGIESVNLQVGAGEIFGCLGPNGAGKSTTIRLMLNFISPTNGTVRIFGHGVSWGGRALRRRVGYLPGELGLHEEMTGEQALNLYRALSGGPAAQRDWLCDRLALDASDRKRRIKKYSKGMKQKIGLIQALQHDPELIILDEPTSGLDPLVQAGLFDILRDLKSRGRTIFFSSHVLSEVRTLCDRVAILMDGVIIRDASVPELLAASDRLLSLRIPHYLDLHPHATPPTVATARFVRRDGDWLLYRTTPADTAAVLEAAARLKPADFRFESALDETFLDFYRKPKAPEEGKGPTLEERK